MSDKLMWSEIDSQILRNVAHMADERSREPGDMWAQGANLIRRLIIDASELAELRVCQRLIYGYMLDSNAVGYEQAAKNLTRGIKEHAIAKEKAG